jgi:hypothetical protein
MNKSAPMIPDEVIMNKIYLIRDRKVMLDKDLAVLYGVSTKALKQQVRRNIERFPEDFMFILTKEEFDDLRSQIVTSSWGGTRYMPMAFTEQGVAMLSSVLNSKQAILVNIRIIRVFTKMRELLASQKEILRKLEQLEKKDIEQDEKIDLIFEYLKQFEKMKQKELVQQERRRIGFKPKKRRMME